MVWRQEIYEKMGVMLRGGRGRIGDGKHEL